MAQNSFEDMLTPGESIVSELAGEGRNVERGHGIERTWWHVALTQERLLVLRMKQSGGKDTWDLIARTAGPRANLRISHFPRTAADSARLSINGCGDSIIYVDVDRPPLQDQVKAFLAAWGGEVLGGDSVAEAEVDQYHGSGKDENKNLLLLAGIMGGILVLCCGCVGFSGILRVIFGLAQ